TACFGSLRPVRSNDISHLVWWGKAMSDATYTISGKGRPGATVTASLVDSKGTTTPVGTLTVPSDGNFSFPPQAAPTGSWETVTSQSETLETHVKIDVGSGPTPPDPPDPPPAGMLTIVISDPLSGRQLTLSENDAVALDGEYKDPKGRFTIRRKVLEVEQILGYRLLFDAHTDGSRRTVGFEYSDVWQPMRLIASLVMEEPGVVTLATTDPHGFSPGQYFQLTGTQGAGEIVNTNFSVGGVVDDKTFTF